VFYFLLTLLILDAFLLMTIVLLQAGKGGGLAAMGGGGGDTLLGGRQAASLLTKATWWTGGVFLAVSFILSMMSSPDRRTDPILRGAGTPGAAPGVVEPTQPAGGQLTPGLPASPQPVTPEGQAPPPQLAPLQP
jgi:preprotein translocase subunit SecG